jgi:hypothetical protein
MTDSGGVAPDSQSDRPERRRGERSAAARLRTLPPELRTAGVASAALAASLILPWYQKSYVPKGSQQFVQANLTAFGVFSFVEAAILLVAVAVIYLMWARANQRAFHLPGGDGTAIFGAGCWALVLLTWRLFDKPNVAEPAATVGIQWGIFVAFVAAGALAATGARVRAAHRPEPPNPLAAADDWQMPSRRREPRPNRRPRDAIAVTDVLRDPPSWQGDPPEPPARRRSGAADDPSEAETRVTPADERRHDPPHDRLF